MIYQLIAYSTYFTLNCTSDGSLAKYVNIKSFIDKNLTEFDFHRIVKRFLPTKKYCIFDRETKLARFPLQLLEKMMLFLDDNGIDYEVIHATAPEGRNIEIEFRNDQYTDRGNQSELIEFMVDSPYTMRPVDAQTGVGKAQPMYSKIHTPTGWVCMGDIKVGDKVLTPEGKTANVVKLYPQGIKEIYEITFEDGRSTHCCIDHLWKIYHHDFSSSASKLMTTREMIEQLNNNKFIHIDTISGNYGGNIELPDDPETIGLTYKIIPQDYFNGDALQRYLILTGINQLLHDNPNAVKYYSETDTCNMIQHMRLYLIRSLGLVAHVSSNNEYSFKPLSKTHSLTLAVSSIKYVGLNLAQCIEIDDPGHLYVTDNFIVTHNTYCTIKAICEIKKVAMILTGGLVNQWKLEFLKYTNLKPDDIYIIQGFDSINRLLKDMKLGIVPKIIIGSLSTVRAYSLPKPDSAYSKIMAFEQFLEELGVGIKVQDECHMFFHAITIIDLRSNVPVNIYLSATYERSNKYGQKIFIKIFPTTLVFGNNEYNQYVDIYLYSYSLGDIHMLRANTSRGYSQSKYELFIEKNVLKYDRYVNEVVKPLIETHYRMIKKKKQKLLILVHTVSMCEKLTYSMENMFPEFNVQKYTYEDPEENLADGVDIIISTPKSAGVGKDIKNLKTLLLSCSLSSSPMTKQILGRLRELPQDDTPVMVDIYNRDVEAHIRHKEDRRHIYEKCGKSFNEFHL